MTDTPAPGIIGNPVPADYGVPDPTAVVIGPPGAVAYPGHPDIAERRFIYPSPIIIQLRFVFIKFGGKIGAPYAAPVERIPGSVPVDK
jgi:hypothetical protein